MSTAQWTITRFIRWRIRDWVSCFLACRFPLDDEPNSSSSPQLPIKNMVFETKEDMRSNNKACKKLTIRKGSRHDSTQDRKNFAMENKNNSSSSWPNFQDEDYIVFCFREDGAFDVVKDCKSEALDRFDNKCPRPINRKLKYNEVAETVRESSNGKRSNAHGNDSCLNNGEGTNSLEENEGEQSSNIGIQSPSVASTRSFQFKEFENGRTASAESSDSNHSNNSTGSFSFPVLHCELVDSPVQMPKSNDLHITKHKIPRARFQCCRF